MATSRTAAGKKTTAKTASSTSAKKPLAKKTVAAVSAAKPKPAAKKTAATPVKKAVATPVKTTIAIPAKAAAPAAGATKVEKTAAATKNATRNTAKKIAVSPEERYHMIATAAYFLAEKHGFNSCYAMRDWIAAEAEIDAKLNAQK